jgi:5-methylcytosine-specific restriction endonuclease McrA
MKQDVIIPNLKSCRWFVALDEGCFRGNEQEILAYCKWLLSLSEDQREIHHRYFSIVLATIKNRGEHQGVPYDPPACPCGICQRARIEAIEEIQSEVDRRRFERSRTYTKQPIPISLRMRVFERDDFTCRHCGARKNLHADHIVAEIKGGLTTIENLQTLCNRCNCRKGSR